MTGAGDTVIAAFAFKLALGKTTSEAAEFSNIAASIAVQKRGAFAVKEKDFVVSNLNNLKEKKKLVTEKELSKIIMKLRKDDKRMVFTNGCFDILHSGHLAFLKSARKLADYLVVGLNSDYSVTQIKGKGRPINSFSERADILSNLSCVDFIVCFNELTPEKLIKSLNPNVLVKGGDYKESEIVGGDFVKKNGEKFFSLGFKKGLSTTNTISKIREIK